MIGSNYSAVFIRTLKIIVKGIHLSRTIRRLQLVKRKVCATLLSLFH